MKFTSLKNKVKGAVSYSNRRCFSANGFSLLPLALEQRLFCLVGITLGMVINLTLFGNATFALDPCLDSTTPCLNVSIANSISLDLKPISPTGTFAKSDTATNTVGVMTNYFAGYTLGIAASSTGADAANLIQTAGEGNEQTVVGRISSIGTVTGVTGAGITEQEFSNANNTQYNNTWGYKVTNLNTTTSTNYLPAPTNTTSISMDTTNAANANTANNYNIAIGARVDTEVPKGSYTNTFVVQVVANPIPYTITYNKNTEDTVANMPSNVNTTTVNTSVTVGSAPSRSGYNFVGWCTTAVADGGTCDSPNTQYAAGGSYTIDQISGENDLVLYAMWAEIPTIIFKAGDNIDAVIVADGSNKYAPQYAVGSTGEAKFENAVVGTKYIVTVVPAANHTLDATTPWTRDTSKGTLASTTLLTTTYTVGNGSETLTANGSSSTASYTKMKDLTVANCPVYNDINTPGGVNVTDERDGKSYTVAKFGSYCYMLSNLRLEGGTALDSSTSNVKGAFTLPDQTTWTSSSQDHYCEARMRYIGNEYYYNWYAAKANPTTGVSSSSSCANTTRDNASLGSICPANWTLPTYNDITAATLWDSGNNPGMLATTGRFDSGSQYGVGRDGSWWSSTRSNDVDASYLNFYGPSAGRYNNSKDNGYSVRCMRSN